MAVCDDDGGGVIEKKEIESSYEEEEEEVAVVLGFVERVENRCPGPQCFLSKAGGVPAWLDPVNLPSGEVAACGFCGDPLQFVLQLYAPVSEEDAAFHRSLFLFMCPSMACLLQDQQEQKSSSTNRRSLKVFRCQIHRHNAFHRDDERTTELCAWCGTWKGDKVCSRCRETRYCSVKHQSLHWSGGGHRESCCGRRNSVSSGDRRQRQWREYGIVSGDEFADGGGEVAVPAAAWKKKKGGELPFDVEAAEDEEMETWASFRERMARAPDQVLRYSRNPEARAVWPMLRGRPSVSDIPPCPCCGTPRVFELQILPQLLYYFNVENEGDSLDWATIVVYTCAASCGESGGRSSYKEEFPWVQLPPH